MAFFEESVSTILKLVVGSGTNWLCLTITEFGISVKFLFVWAVSSRA